MQQLDFLPPAKILIESGQSNLPMELPNFFPLFHCGESKILNRYSTAAGGEFEVENVFSSY